MKKVYLIIGFLILGSLKFYAQQEKYVNSESNYYCQCYKSFNKEKRKLDRKSERKQKKDAKPKKYKPGMKLFGGCILDFNLKECLDKKRDKKTKMYIESLNETEKEKFQIKVNSLIKEKCPKNKLEY